MIELIKHNWAIYFFTIAFVSFFTTGFIFLIAGLVDTFQNNGLNLDNLYFIFLGAGFGVVFGSFVTIPMGIIAITIFHQLSRKKKQSTSSFGLVGLCFGLLIGLPFVYFSELFNFEGVFALLVLLGGGYITGSIIYIFWRDDYVPSTPKTK